MRFAGNPWVADVLAAMQAIVDERDAAIFVTEASYANRLLSSRLVAKSEVDFLGMVQEMAAPSYLQRRIRQGRAAPADGGGASDAAGSGPAGGKRPNDRPAGP